MKNIILMMFITGSLAMAKCEVYYKTHLREIMPKITNATKKISAGMALKNTTLSKEGAKEMVALESQLNHLLAEHYNNLSTDEINQVGRLLKAIENIKPKL